MASVNHHQAKDCFIKRFCNQILCAQILLLLFLKLTKHTRIQALQNMLSLPVNTVFDKEIGIQKTGLGRKVSLF